MTLPSEANFISQLRNKGIPYRITRFDRADQATAAYSEGKCEAFAATKSVLAARARHIRKSKYSSDRPSERKTDSLEYANV